jgi:DNA anti-recombination protein RmuC
VKKFTIALVSAALGTCISIPLAHAQSDEHINSDANRIQEQHEKLYHDRNELRNDLRNGDFGAAREEQEEMERRRDKINDERQDLNNDLNSRYERHHDEGED